MTKMPRQTVEAQTNNSKSFLEQYKVDIDRLLKIALDNSPIKKICFLTGYQLGRLHGNTEIIYTIEDFWEQHNSYGLSINTMYEMYGK